ncbi:T9SS C-terminal target domain-containing protein [Lacihabitans sp. CCS-44]|nr:T9SS C-terminal target domain-containing protein [Lacihabitans sp. CCS-44]
MLMIMKKCILLLLSWMYSYIAYSQACVGTGTANITFVSSSGETCNYNIAMSVTTTQNAAKAARFSILNASPVISPVCKINSTTIINCATATGLSNLGDGFVITHTFSNVTFPCGTQPQVSIEGTTNNATSNGFNCTAITTTSSNANPVKISYFKGLSQENQISLNWETETETSFSHFVVQRSGNAQEFGDLQIIKAKGESTEKTTYQFIDQNPFPGMNYYRLRQLDNDGSISYSKIIDINAEGGASETLIYPNPGSGSFNIKSNETILESEAYNSSGKSVAVKLEKSGDKYQLDFLQKPESGLYFLKVRTLKGMVKYRIAIY